MSRLRTLSGRAKAAACALCFVASINACGEDGKTAPDKCAEPPLPIYDIQAGAPDVSNPCLTKVGDAVSSVGPQETTGGAGG